MTVMGCICAGRPHQLIRKCVPVRLHANDRSGVGREEQGSLARTPVVHEPFCIDEWRGERNGDHSGAPLVGCGAIRREHQSGRQTRISLCWAERVNIEVHTVRDDRAYSIRIGNARVALQDCCGAVEIVGSPHLRRVQSSRRTECVKVALIRVKTVEKLLQFCEVGGHVARLSG